jgi:hypothetical protein
LDGNLTSCLFEHCRSISNREVRLSLRSSVGRAGSGFQSIPQPQPESLGGWEVGREVCLQATSATRGVQGFLHPHVIDPFSGLFE